MTLEEFNALVERDLEYQDLLEYCAALSPWAFFNVHRTKDTPFMEPLEFMLRRRARLSLAAEVEPVKARGRPARLLAPVPKVGMRYALKGERPPSKFNEDEDDGVIDRFDAWARNRR